MIRLGSTYQAVILAAGRGSRLHERTGEVPKALLPIGPRSTTDATETCFLRRQVELLQSFGVADVTVVVGYLGHLIRREVGAWAPWVKLVENPTPEIATSGSLHSFQFAVRSPHGILDGKKQTLLMDADIVYHPRVLEMFLESPARSSLLVCKRHVDDGEEVLVYGSLGRPRFLGKGLSRELAAGEPCLGEATGIVKYAPADHALARATIDWLLGDPDAPAGSARHKGYGPARRATEHEELAQRFMMYDRIDCVPFGEELPFMEVDSAAEYALLRDELYPRLLRETALAT